MKILAIDTSLGSGSVAAADEGGGDEMPLGPAGEHARVLTKALIEVASRRGWGEGSNPITGLGPDDVVAVVRGPGSFTGLRVGVTAAKAIAWTTGCHLVGVSGFEVIARRTGRLDGWMDTPVAIAYDAGRGEVFAAWAEPAATDALGWRLAAPCLIPFDDWLGSLPSGSHVSGPAVDAHRERLVDHGGVVCASREACLPFALDTAAIAGLKALAGAFDDPRTLVPDYLRPSYAEEAKPGGSGSPTP